MSTLRYVEQYAQLKPFTKLGRDQTVPS
jgi:hypothetical protein